MRTAATSPAVAASATKRPQPRRRRARLTVRATVLLAVIGAIVFLSVAPARLYFAQRAELAALEREASAMEAGNQRLSERAEQLRDGDELERLARECLGMVRPGEVAFVVVPAHGAPTPPRGC